MRKRLVRIHLSDMPGQQVPSFEGIFVGWPARNAGHYVLENCRLLAPEGGSTALEGKQFVPKERVLFVQELSQP